MAKTVKVRIAVAVDPTGDWNCAGAKNYDDGEAMGWAIDPLQTGEARYFVTAELPLPQSNDIAGTVEVDRSEDPSDAS